MKANEESLDKATRDLPVRTEVHGDLVVDDDRENDSQHGVRVDGRPVAALDKVREVSFDDDAGRFEGPQPIELASEAPSTPDDGGDEVLERLRSTATRRSQPAIE